MNNIHVLKKQERPIHDFINVVRVWGMWLDLGINDVYSRYRRAFLGPIWIVLGNGLALAAVSVLWTLIFGLDWRNNIIYIICGYIIWQYISAYIIGGADLFSMEARPFIKSTPIAPTFFAARFCSRALVNFAHSWLIIFVASVIASKLPTLFGLLGALVGVLIITLNGFFWSILIGLAGARFRDISHAIGALITPVFMITPVLWRPDMLGAGRTWLAEFNPLTHFIAIVRNPYMGEPIDSVTASAVAAITIANILICLACYVRFRRNLVYWVA